MNSSTQKKKSYQITIKGRVQNVGFRYHTHEKAIKCGVVGFVMNQANGDVYVETEGLEGNVNEFIKWCYQGPDWAKVLDIKVIEQPLCDFEVFKIKR